MAYLKLCNCEMCRLERKKPYWQSVIKGKKHSFRTKTRQYLKEENYDKISNYVYIGYTS